MDVTLAGLESFTPRSDAVFVNNTTIAKCHLAVLWMETCLIVSCFELRLGRDWILYHNVVRDEVQSQLQHAWGGCIMGWRMRLHMVGKVCLSGPGGWPWACKAELSSWLGCCCRRAANTQFKQDSCSLLDCEPADLQDTLLEQVGTKGYSPSCLGVTGRSSPATYALVAINLV